MKSILMSLVTYIVYNKVINIGGLSFNGVNTYVFADDQYSLISWEAGGDVHSVFSKHGSISGLGYGCNGREQPSMDEGLRQIHQVLRPSWCSASIWLPGLPPHGSPHFLFRLLFVQTLLTSQISPLEAHLALFCVQSNDLCSFLDSTAVS